MSADGTLVVGEGIVGCERIERGSFFCSAREALFECERVFIWECKRQGGGGIGKNDVVSGEEEGVAGGLQVRYLRGHTCGHDVRIR